MEYQLSEYYKKKKSNRDIFQELMSFKVKEILLVANLYDSYSVAREGEFFDRIAGEYRQLNLYAAPRISSTTNPEETFEALEHNMPDMVILMAGLDKKMPLELAEKIKEKYPELAILVLVNNNSDLKYFGYEGNKSKHIDRVFVWNGDSKVFLAMTKYVEDQKNVASDTVIGDVRVILLVEDSIRYYTRYLPILYSILMKQTQNVVDEHSVDDLHKILKMRGRPKILLASNYEEAISIVNQFGENLLCVISDVSFKKNGEQHLDAGIMLLQEITKRLPVPCLMQSSDYDNKTMAAVLGVDFLWKDSDTLAHDIMQFLNERCGFGDFQFKLHNGEKIASAKTINQFAEMLDEVPDESLSYHASRQGISSWFMAHSEINLAKKLRRHALSNNISAFEIRKYIKEAIFHNYLQKQKGRVIEFDANFLTSDRLIVRLGNGSLGGKGRGMAFLSHFTENIEFQNLLPNINITIPKTAVIGVEEFDLFIEENDLYSKVYTPNKSHQEIKDRFVKAELSSGLKKKLKTYVSKVNKPLAVRSSGLFEDSMLQPFAGVYATYFLPNNSPDIEVRAEQLAKAVKLVYSSIFCETAVNYFEATKYKIEEEKMGVIIQEMVGETYGQYFYPQISGVAQSYNYYPFSYMKPDDGFSVSVIGMGEAVVGGEKSHRFCPKYPKLELISLPDQIKDSQTHFYALDLESGLNENNETIQGSITKLPIKQAEQDGNLKHCAQVFDMNNQMLSSNFNQRGPRVVNFANILKYDHAPLAQSLSILLSFFEQAMGSPVEIEYAMTMKPKQKASIHLLQIKPLIKQEEEVNVNIEKIAKDKAILLLHGGMGNGHYSHIEDVIYVDVNKFDKTQTQDIAKEVAELNKILQAEDREYILIGPGRWGSRDKFIGIPVFWSQIANARLIVEMGLKELPLEASLGSHFFHNVTSMNVGYFAAPHNAKDDIVNLDLLNNQELINETTHLKHVRIKGGLDIKMDGKNRLASVSLE